MRNGSRVSALALVSVALWLQACGDDDSAGGADAGGSGGRDGSGGGTPSGGRTGTGGRAASGGADASMPGSGGARGGEPGDAALDGADADVPWPECPASEVDGGDAAAADGGALYPACEAPPSVAKHPIHAFPVGIYELEVHALFSANTAAGPSCRFAPGTATLSITLGGRAPCCGDACLMNPASEIVVTVRSPDLQVGEGEAGTGFELSERATVSGEQPLKLAFSDPRRSYTVTVNRATGGIVVTGFHSAQGAGGTGDLNTYWEGRGSLACTGAPARTSPPPFPRQLPKTLACAKNLAEPEDWERSCRYDHVIAAETCATSTRCQDEGETRVSCADEATGFYSVCCPE